MNIIEILRNVAELAKSEGEIPTAIVIHALCGSIAIGKDAEFAKDIQELVIKKYMPYADQGLQDQKAIKN